MPSILHLTSGDHLRVDSDPDEAVKQLSPTAADAYGFVTLQVDGKDLHVRPGQVMAVEAADDGPPASD